MKQKRMGFTFATLPEGGFILRVVGGATSTVFPNQHECAKFLRGMADRIENAPLIEPWWVRLRRRILRR